MSIVGNVASYGSFMSIAEAPTFVVGSQPKFAHYCTSIVNRIGDLLWERKLGVRPRGRAESPHHDAHAYGYLSYHTYFTILDRLLLQPSDVVVDLGCGKGRIVCCAACYDIREAIGVEIDPQLARSAKNNVSQLRLRRAPARITTESAIDFDFDATTVVVMFHPFGIKTLEGVLQRIDESCRRIPRRLRIVYANPLFDHVLAAQDSFTRYDAWLPKTWDRLKFPVYFYEHRS